MFHENELAFSATVLTSPEATGHTAIVTGRRHQLPADWPQAWTRWLADPVSPGPNARLAARTRVPSHASRPLIRPRQRRPGNDAAPQAA